MDSETRPPSAGGHSSALDKLTLILWFGIGLGLAALAMAQAPGWSAALGIGGLIFLTAFATGGLLGFLFGVPRVLSHEHAASAAASPMTASSLASPSSTAAVSDGAAAPSGNAPAASARLLQSNTNLERISDWLTTLLVGAGLVQLHKINDALLGFRAFLQDSAKVFGEGASAHAGTLPTVGPIVLVFGLICGFLYMYLNTRLALVHLFYAVESRLLAGDEKLPATEQRAVKEIVKKGDGLGNFLHHQFSEKKTITVQDALSLMLDFLDNEKPDKAIDVGVKIANTDVVKRAEYWYYMVIAFGQKLVRMQADTADWISTRDDVLDCARRAVNLDPAYRDRLWAISDPNGPDQYLTPLRGDPAFLNIVGRQ